MNMRYPVDTQKYKRMNSEELRNNFLVDEMFNPGQIDLTYSFTDRAVIGSAVPTGKTLELEGNKKYLSADYFTQRREVGVFNIGNTGTVTVNGEEYVLNNKEILYIGRENEEVKFDSKDAANPAQFYIMSYPAHKKYETQKGTKEEANLVELGDQEHASTRSLYQMIHPDGIPSCQLVMGYTELADGNVWNTMPAHTHLRRSEVYMYFDVDEDNVVFHLMGEPDEVRPLVMRNGDAVISPEWSFHGGSGTSNYAFVWAMGGENQDFDDMDLIDLNDLS
ncbi:MAG: 5-dehydro-4-deoxy-D-glucuronate isomerase [Candidatus Marinimicrobia bacterium]|nr:5-dehydro-4-deoxy-D-glucuronate isomerase [Candidatus Neomarinimicrobiota bacterium]MCF7827419.1 5-dehydro-4-deoxy-D-glucuronate isomerase [Candidatus Neomarinimicrobiota bacterium]MCF7881348.1 5-dehydro-4-deoxy-D-glucuronate isomerase [Candidatus Neomarinimicrobiota bacterium]